MSGHNPSFRKVRVRHLPNITQRIKPRLGQVRKMLDRMAQANSAKVLTLVSDGTISNFESLLPEKMQPVGQVLQLTNSWPQEIQDLKGNVGNMSACLQKLAVFEAAYVASQDSMMNQDEFFGKSLAGCKEFANVFLETMTESLGMNEKSLCEPVTNFLDKYKGVVACATTWSMKEVEWVFSPSNEHERKDDLEKFIKIKDALNEPLAAMAPCMQTCSDTCPACHCYSFSHSLSY